MSIWAKRFGLGLRWDISAAFTVRIRTDGSIPTVLEPPATDAKVYRSVE